MFLTLLTTGLTSGHQTAHASAHWGELQAAHLQQALSDLVRLPKKSTVLRTLRQIDVVRLEHAIAQVTQPHMAADSMPRQVVTPCGTILQAQAVDGKTLRGATAAGGARPSGDLVQHGGGGTLAQAAVAQQRNEMTAVPFLVRGRDLTDTIRTMDSS